MRKSNFLYLCSNKFSNNNTMIFNINKKYITLIIFSIVIILALVYYFFFTPLSSSKQSEYLYIDNDDNVDSVITKLSSISNNSALIGFRTLVRHSSYNENIKEGRYEIKPGNGAFVVFRRLKNGAQSPVRLTIPTVRTLDRLAGEVSKRMMFDSLSLYNALKDTNVCKQYGYDTTTIACMFIPNTYELYWNCSVEKFLERMKKESDKFWDDDRTYKAKSMGLTKNEVITLASIVDEETSNDKEKPMIAGMYYNRLKLRNVEYPNGMPLQADPTIKFALKQFELKRIYNNMLYINSPYNTYRNTGLPPGPIRIPTIAGIDAVLNHVKHNYLYMCAKEDFSGTHNFAVTYHEHMLNAQKYSAALNNRGIK